MAVTRVLMTGAAGIVGRMLRQRLQGIYPLLRVSDIGTLAPAGSGEEAMICDLTDADATRRLCEGMDAIIHLGGISTDEDWPVVFPANVLGLVNLYEGARLAGVDRVLFASSNHVIGLYPRTERLDHMSPARPDCFYGLTKAFGEDVARLYADKHGVRSFVMRIGTAFPDMRNERMRSTWISDRDMTALVRVGLEADYLYEIVYGVSNNTRGWWDNSNAYRLGYAPQDDAETVAAAPDYAEGPEEPVAARFQGGAMAARGYTNGREQG